jgi:hypothetical protein
MPFPSGLVKSVKTFGISKEKTIKKMKKDIIIPEVENVFIAAVQEWAMTLWRKCGMLI